MDPHEVEQRLKRIEVALKRAAVETADLRQSLAAEQDPGETPPGRAASEEEDAFARWFWILSTGGGCAAGLIGWAVTGNTAWLSAAVLVPGAAFLGRLVWW
jgi:hypothetical protein